MHFYDPHVTYAPPEAFAQSANRQSRAGLNLRALLSLTKARAASETDDQRVEIDVRTIKILLSLGPTDAALALADRLMIEHPGDIKIQLAGLRAKVQAGRSADSEAIIAPLLHDHPESLPALVSIAEIKRTQGQFAQALEIIGHARNLDPDSPSLVARHAELAAAVGRDHLALCLARSAVQQIEEPWRLEVLIRELEARSPATSGGRVEDPKDCLRGEG